MAEFPGSDPGRERRGRFGPEDRRVSRPAPEELRARIAHLEAALAAERERSRVWKQLYYVQLERADRLQALLPKAR